MRQYRDPALVGSGAAKYDESQGVLRVPYHRQIRALKHSVAFVSAQLHPMPAAKLFRLTVQLTRLVTPGQHANSTALPGKEC